jgi:hypothetical protein
MNKKIILLFGLLFVIIFSLTIITNAEEIEIKIILGDNETLYTNDTRLSDKEDLLFYVCPNTEVSNVQASLICKETFKFISLDTIDWKDKCYLSKYDLEDINCENLQILFEYKEKNQQIKLTKDVKIGKNSNILGYILNRQNANGGFDQNPLYTTYAIWAMSNYKDIYTNEIEAALSWLKFNRDETNKCWPKNNCEITTTSQILFLLKDAGFDEDYRIVNDAKIWIEKNQNYLNNDLWKIRIDASDVYVKDNAKCNITYNNIITQKNITMNTAYELNISVSNNKDIKIDCDQEVQTTMYDQFGAVVYSKDQKNLNYHIGDACWGIQHFQTCKEYSNDNFVKYDINIDANDDYMYTDMNITITNDTSVACTIQYGGQLATFQVPSNRSYDYNLLVNQEDDIIINCNYFTKISVYNEDYQTLISNISRNITYKIKNNCDLTNRYTSCDVKATSAAIAAGSDSETANLAYNWMINNSKEDVVGRYIVSKDIYANELFVLATPNSSIETGMPVIEWLKFNQNNDGSWGYSTKIRENLIETIYGALALSKYNTSASKEIIDDAKQWIRDYEPDLGWGDVEKDALAFWAVKDQIKPFIKTNPEIISVNQDEIQVNLINPTDFNIKDISFEFTDGLDDFVSVEPVAEIFKKSYKRIVLKLKSKKEETHYGFMIIRNKRYQLAKIPVITSKLPDLNIKLQSETTIYGDKTKIKATILSKSNGTFACTLKWDTTLIDKAFTVNNENSLDISIETKEVKRQTKNVTGEIICTKDQNTVRNPTYINIDQFTTKPFDVQPKSLIVIETKKDTTFTIENLIEKSITITVDFDKDDGLFEFDKRRLTINPFEKENITIINLVPEKLNFSQDYTIIVSALGQEEKIPFRVSIIETEDKKANFTNLYIILILLFIFTIAWGVLKLNKLSQKQYDIMQKWINQVRKNTLYQIVFAPLLEKLIEKKFPIQIETKAGPEKVNVDADIVVAVKFMKTLGKDDTTIKTKLKANGFSEAYIQEVLKQIG